MFGLFKKKTAPAPRGVLPNPASRTRRSAESLPWDAPSLPEVTEGNSDADWSAWQDSVNFQESRSFANSQLSTEPTPLESHAPEADHVFEHAARRKNS